MLPSSWMKFRFALPGPHLGGVLLGQVAQRRDVRVAEQGVVVEVDLGVEHDHVALLGDGQRVDLGQAASLSRKTFDSAIMIFSALATCSPVKPSSKASAAGLERLQARSPATPAP